jgi:hypothetical protein
MAKANLILPDGTKVNIEGSADEVAVLLEKFSARESSNEDSTTTKKKSKKKRKTAATGKGGRTGNKQEGPTSLVTELVNDEYFKTKRTLGDIQKKLEERGHIYAQTSISPALTRLTRKRVIRRIKEKKVWVYVK